MAIDWAAYYKNRSEFPPEELEKYAGQWIAWAPDGASIVASSAVDPLDLDVQVCAAGQDPSECCVSYIPHKDDILAGAIILHRALGLPKLDGQIDPPSPPCSRSESLERKQT